MEKSKVTAIINVYARKSITIAGAFIAFFCLSGCLNMGWLSSTDLIPDRDAVNPFESAKYIGLFREDNPTDSDNSALLLQRKSGKYEIFILSNPSDPSFATTTKFYNIGDYFGSKKYIWGWDFSSSNSSINNDAYWYFYVTENRICIPEGDSLEALEVNSISEIKESINSGIKLNCAVELRVISSIQAAQLRQEGD